MAQTGFTPIQLYSSSTTGNTPAAGNLSNSADGSELAINIFDGKLFYKDNAGAVQVIGWKVVPVSAGGTGQTSYTDGQLLIGNTTGNTLTKTTLTAGTGISITNGAGAITINATGGTGTVTSVTGTAPISVATGTTTPVISISQSGVATDGYLSSADWNTFNNKQPAGSYLTAVTADAPLSGAGTAGSHLVIAQANTSTSGYLSSTDWNTFNNKVSMVFPGAGIPNSTGSAWGTSYTTTGSGTVVALQTSPSLTSPTIDGAAPYITFNNGVAVSVAAGRMWYNGSTGSWNLGMGGGNITQQVGEELYIYGKASSAIADSPLQIVYQTGTVGASGTITFAPTVAGITDGNLIVGIATESIALNGFGRVTSFGVVHGITTDGTAYGEAWADGDTIWYSPATGNPTKTKPTAPSIKVKLGTVLNAGSGGSGSFQTEITHGSTLGGTDSNVNLVGTPSNGQLLTYDTADTYWTNTTLTAGTGISVSAAVGGALTITNTSPSSGGTVTSVAALTLGTTGTDLSSTVANGATTPVITLNVPTASAANRGALSAADWSTFNGKQAALVSGTNIKTVGGVSLLGAGDVGTIGVGYGGTGQTSFTAGRVLYGNNGGALASSASLFFDGSNLGLGGTPSAWAQSQSLQVNRASIYSDGGFTAFSNNWYSNAGDKYIATDFATQYYQYAGGHVWRTAPSGTAGTAIPFIQAMALNAAGGLQTLNTIGVGNATPSASGAGITFPATQSASTDANTLDDYQEYTAPSAACTGAITTAVVWKATKIGNVVTLTLPPTTGVASTATNFVYGELLPADFRPSATIAMLSCPIKDADANVSVPGMIFILTSGAIRVYKDASALTNFTAGLNAGIGQSCATSVSWTI